MDTVYLVDGSGYIFRAYYAIGPLSTRSGFPTNALYGFSRMLSKLIKDVSAQFIGVAFDCAAPTFRHEIYPSYKANRAKCPEDLALQMPYFRLISRAFGLKTFEKEGVEADDIIATLTRALAGIAERVVIVSGDKDLLQLVGPGVEMWDAMRDVSFGPAEVIAKHGVGPSQMVDYLALTGDASDNVPGVPGVGPKTAAKLLEHFGSLDQLLEKTDEISQIAGLRGAISVGKAIESRLEALRLSRRLVRLLSDVEPFNRVSTLKDLQRQEADYRELSVLFEELEFEKLLEDESFFFSSPVGHKPKQTEGKRYTTVSAAELEEFAALLASVPVFAFDTETTSLDVLQAELVGISFSWERHRAFYLPLRGNAAPERLLDAEEVLKLVGPVFSNPNVKKVGCNLKFDMGVLEENGYTVRGLWFDAMLCSHVLTPESRHGLKHLTKAYLGEEMVTFAEVVGDEEHIGLVDLDRVAKYACHDADASWGLFEVLDDKLGPAIDGSGLRRVFQEVEMPLVEVLSKIERRGVMLDTEFLKRLGEETTSDLLRLEQEIYELAGLKFNINSPKQLSAVLFEKLGIPTKGVKKTTGGYSTDAAVLLRLAPEHEIIEKILEYRELHKLKSTYIDALQRLVHPKTGRVHTSFNQAVTATGRLSSSEPNLQNIPVRNARGRQIRKAFIGEAGSVLVSADYSQIELRVLAHLSRDENLCQAFYRGEDIHLSTAREIFSAEELAGEQSKELRRVAKTINFGVLYGIGPSRLARELGISRRDAEAHIERYFARYPRVLDYFDRLRKDIASLGYVETMFGRRRYLKDVETEGRDAGYADRSLMNAPIQGSAAEIIKVAMANLNRRLEEEAASRGPLWAFMVLQVHDELVFEVREEHAAFLADVAVHEMESAVALDVPLKVDVTTSRTWGA